MQANTDTADTADVENPGLDAFHHTRLEHLRQMVAAGVRLAIPAACFYCATHKLAIPAWLVAANANLWCREVREAADGSASGLPKMIADYRQDMVHYGRWSMIDEILRERLLTEESCTELSRLKGPKARSFLKEKKALGNWLGENLETAFACASEMLAGTDQAGSPDTIKRSYQLVQRLDDPRAMRFHLLDADFLRIVGIGLGSGRSQDHAEAPWLSLILE